MSLKYGLIVKNKTTTAAARRPVLDEDDGDDDDGEDAIIPDRPRAGGLLRKLPSLRKDDEDDGQDLSSLAASQARVKAAEDSKKMIFDAQKEINQLRSDTEREIKEERKRIVEQQGSPVQIVK